MRFAVLLLLVLSLLATPVVALGAEPTPAARTEPAEASEVPVSTQALDLEAALRLAEQSSPSLRQARSRVAEAGFRVDEAFVPAYPNLQLSAGYTHIDPEIQVPLGPRPVTIAAADNYLVNLAIQQNLLTFGRLEWGTEAAELSRRAAESDLSAAQANLREYTEALYRGALSAREGVAVAEEALLAARAQLQDSENLVREGVAAPFDVIRSRSQVLQAEQDLLSACQRRDAANLRLAVHLGLPSEPPLDLAAAPSVPPPPEALADAVTVALQARPELEALRYSAEAAGARTRFTGSQDNPLLSLNAGYLRRNEVAFTREYQWTAGLQLAVPLYDGGLTAARVGQAEEAAAQVRARLEESERAVRVEVESTWLDLRTAWNQVRVARQKLIELQEARRLANLRYQSGISTNVERLEAEAAWTQARFGLVRSELDYALAWARWVRVAARTGGLKP